MINFQKWMEEVTIAANSVSAEPQTNVFGGTSDADVAKVPKGLGCLNCSKDFKNWYEKRKKRK